MKSGFTKWTFNLGAIALCAVLLQAAENTIRYGYRQGTKVSIDGTSTIHDWTVEGSIIGGIFEVESAFATDKTLKSVASLNTKGKAPLVDVSIPVRSLKSKYTKMDEIMQEAMRMKENPKILYRCTEMVVKGEVPASGTPVKFDTVGELAISGVTNKVDMEITMERLDGDMIKFTSAKKLKMTDFKITPPSPSISGGLIKTGDDVTVKFEWLLGTKKAQ
jgi:polyisoprenoid-binding protein YceI